MKLRLSRHGARPADPHLRLRLAALIERRGLKEAAFFLDVHERTLARVASGASVRLATAELLASRYLELQPEEDCSIPSEPRLRLVRGDDREGDR